MAREFADTPFVAMVGFLGAVAGALAQSCGLGFQQELCETLFNGLVCVFVCTLSV